MSPNTSDDLVRVAYHQAGHVVVADRTGLDDVIAEIVEATSSGRVLLRTPVPDYLPDPLALVLLAAGHVAEGIFDGRDVPEMAADLWVKAQAAASWHGDDAFADEAQIWKILMRLGEEDSASSLESWVDTASAMLETPWEEVEDVAKKLLGTMRNAERASHGPTPDPLDQLARLAMLRDSGVITDEEFSAKKAELLARL